MCMAIAPAPVARMTSRMAGSRNPVTSLTISAPAARAARATAGFHRVDGQERCAGPAQRAAPMTGGRTRRNSSASGTGTAPGPRGFATDIDDRRALRRRARGRGPRHFPRLQIARHPRKNRASHSPRPMISP